MAVPLIAIFGPTGVGKTALALELGDRLRERGRDPVAISADALQVYEGLQILTGAAGPAERERLEHRLQGYVPVTEEYSAGRYSERAHAEIDSALESGRAPIVVGGTGLYLRAALADLDLAPAAPPELRGRLEALDPGDLHARVQGHDAALAASIDPADGKRLVRTLELLEMGETPPHPGDERSQLWTAQTRHPTLLIGLSMQREALYSAIDTRVDAMVKAGAEEEVRRADAAGASRTARYALGFDDLLRGDVEGMKRRTRNYARRQLTWMRKLEGVRLTDVTDRALGPLADSVAAAHDVDL